jgi:preprotein translocase SecE subunit
MRSPLLSTPSSSLAGKPQSQYHACTFPSFFLSALFRYFQESLVELHQVRWATRKQAVRLTVITVVFVIISSVAFGLVDAAFTQIIRSTL